MIFVTGGTGMVGAHMLVTLCKSGQEVKASYRSEQSLNYTKKVFAFYQQEALFDKISWLKLDLRNGFDVNQALTGVSQVYHCAATVDLQKASAAELIHTNMEITSNLVDAALLQNVEAFCHVSSVATLAETPHGVPADEEAIWTTSEKKSPYAISKFHSEMEVWRAHSEGLNTIIVNPSVIIGPARANTGSGLLFRQVWKGMPFYTSGGTGVVDVNDVTEAMHRLMQAKAYGQRFVLNGENITYKSLFTYIAKAMGKKAPSRLLSKRLLMGVSSLTRFLHRIIPVIPAVNKTLVRTAFSQQLYSAEKIQQEYDFSFQPANEMINQAAPFLKKQLVNS